MSDQALTALIQAHRLLLNAFEAAILGRRQPPDQVPQKAPDSHDFLSEEDDAIINKNIEFDRQNMMREWQAQQATDEGLAKIFAQNEIEPLSSELQSFIGRNGADPIVPGDDV